MGLAERVLQRAVLGSVGARRSDGRVVRRGGSHDRVDRVVLASLGQYAAAAAVGRVPFLELDGTSRTEEAAVVAVLVLDSVVALSLPVAP